MVIVCSLLVIPAAISVCLGGKETFYFICLCTQHILGQGDC